MKPAELLRRLRRLAAKHGLEFTVSQGKNHTKVTLAYVPPLVAAKLALHDAMAAAGVSNVALARLLGTDEKAVRRLRDPLHRSGIDQVDTALRALGLRVGVIVEAA